MPVEYICDGCEKREKGWFDRHGDAHKPRDWYIRSDDDGTQVACSRKCIKKIATATGKPDVILPI